MVFLAGLLVTSYLGFKRKPVAAAMIFAVDLIVFVLVRAHIRSLYLKPFTEKFSTVAENTQYGIMVLFFVVLAAGLGVIAWLLIKTAKEHKTG
ncbi:MAG: hypothetical protein GY950_20810 [bacterium]|nr:hypothetical protein [bacterium]